MEFIVRTEITLIDATHRIPQPKFSRQYADSSTVRRGLHAGGLAQ